MVYSARKVELMFFNLKKGGLVQVVGIIAYYNCDASQQKVPYLHVSQAYNNVRYSAKS